MDPDQDREEEEGMKMCKKAGIPEMTADTLPSTVVQKMLSLGFLNFAVTSGFLDPNRPNIFLGQSNYIYPGDLVPLKDVLGKEDEQTPSCP